MRWRGFGRSLLFAALAGLASFPLTVALLPLLGWWGASSAVFTLWVSLYAMGLLRSATARAAALLSLLSLAIVLHGAGANFQSVAVALGVALAFVRSGFAFSMRPVRAVVVESAIGALALGMLHFFGGGGPVATALGVWGYFLVQSVFFLAGGRGEREAGPVLLDPFEEARRNAESLLDRM